MIKWGVVTYSNETLVCNNVKYQNPFHVVLSERSKYNFAQGISEKHIAFLLARRMEDVIRALKAQVFMRCTTQRSLTTAKKSRQSSLPIKMRKDDVFDQQHRQQP